jgi:hypothetical protein
MDMDLRGLFDALYDKLLLRDVFGKVVPGIALITTTLTSLLGFDILDHILARMTVMLWLVIIGFSWLIGFALQHLGEVCGALRTCPRGRDKKWTRDTFHAEWVKFHEIAAPFESVHAERLVVIKEACGNAAVSIVAGLIVALFGVVVKGLGSWYPFVPFAVVGLGLALSLWRMHVIHVERYGDFVRKTISHHEQGGPERDSINPGTEQSHVDAVTREKQGLSLGYPRPPKRRNR